MSDYVTLSCPSCGGQLEITSDIDRFACAHCGTEHIVRRGGGLVSLSPVVEGIHQVRMGVDRTASELAIPRLEKQVAQLEAMRRRTPDQFNRYWLIGIVCALVFVGIAGYTWYETETLFCVAPLLIGAVTFAIFALMANRRNKQLTDAIKQELAQKQAELDRHREIVSTI
jgi:hypothetical protein